MSNFTIDERLLKLLEVIQKKPYSSLDYLAEALGVSTRTIRNYIKQLNQDLDGIASVVNEKGKGYWLTVFQMKQFDEMMQKSIMTQASLDSPGYRIAFIIGELMNHDDMVFTLDELAFQMNIGRTTLVNELKKASFSLKTYDLEIRGKPNGGLSLIGDELDLRFFIIDNLFDYLYGTYPLDQDVVSGIEEIFQRYDLESTTRTLLTQYLIVMLDRLLKNHPLTNMSEKHQRLLDTAEYQMALEIVATIESLLPIKIPAPEILFITIPIAGRRTPTNNRSLADIIINEDVIKLLDRIIEEIGFNKQVIKEHESIFKDLLYHLTFMLNRLLFGIRLKNPLIADVKEKYPVAYNMAKIAGRVIEQEYQLKVSEDEIGYIAFYFGVFVAQSELKMKQIRKAAVICGTGRGTAKIVAIQLERILDRHTQLDLYSESEVSEEILASYDLVFSTIKLPFQLDKPLIIINELFDEKRVSKQIENATYKHSFKLQGHSYHQSFINQLMNQDKFFVLDDQKTYHENVENMVKNLSEKGYLDDGFLQRLEEREKKGSMIFDQFIALPHTFQQKSNRIELAVGVFPQPVEVSGKAVKLVFLLGIPEQHTENNEHLLVKVYEEIIRFANDEERIKALAAAPDYESFAREVEQVIN